MNITDPEPPKRSWWRRFWQWRPAPYRSRSDRLSPSSQGEATKFWLRGGR
jgi:hypothetical protein